LLFENTPVVAVIDRDLRFVGLNAAFRSVKFGRAYCCDHLDASRPHVGRECPLLRRHIVRLKVPLQNRAAG